MFCWNCGANVGDTHLFCENCGARVRTIGEPPAQKIMAGHTMQQGQPNVQIQQGQPDWQMQQVHPEWQEQAFQQKDAFSVKKLPVVMIVILTIGLFISSMFADSGSMTFAMLFSSVSGLLLLLYVYKLDSIEPEPLPLLIKLFLTGGILVPIGVIIVEEIVELVLEIFFIDSPILYSALNAFLVAATVEELGKYIALKRGSWNHPAFNFRFDGIVYATTVAMGFEIVENLLYIASYGFGTALGRAAFPGHLVFSIYMGYYYGQAKSHAVRGDLKGAARLRRKAVIIPIIIHGFYDTLCFWAELNDSTLYVLGSLVVLILAMTVLNVKAYKNIRKYAHEDRPL
ncbi:PrsW family glutamic-type intramembrane protease [Butyrivibrio sp. VCD2006]|uniref:PrsW family glutamic-type intramembrane protease n=1 Tax=Butyrivibrio sp. VCD2006 TaxID=1280664 RepID=UPI0003F8DAB4|nr:PrsW family glutamic-type intramembrane protease [Butyrivibrio sp. VCD2006]